MKKLISLIDDLETRLIEIRRQLHQWPETGLSEVKTCQIIEDLLKEWEIPFHRLNPTGLVAWIGPDKGTVVGLRADIDGLLLCEETGLPYCSKREGYMHACGHDVHTAGLLGAAYALKKMEQELKGRVKLIFQPAEENCKGANLVLESGWIDDVDSLLGLHIFSDLPYGSISIEPGPRMARTDRFEIRLKGKGGHAAKPHQCVDATIMAAALCMNLQTIISRNTDPVDTAVLTIGSIHSGTQYNIISGEAVLTGTIRSFRDETADFMIQKIDNMVKTTAASFGGEGCLIAYPTSHPPLINDEKVARDAKEAFLQVAENEQIVYTEKMLLGEDFSNYQKKIPSAFGFIGGGKKAGTIYPNHHPSFEIDERGIALMAKCYGAYALKMLTE